jgi:hypothetical protein
VSTNRSAKAFAPRAAGRDLHCLDTGGGEDRVERVSELPGAVADQEPEVRGVIAKIHQEVAGLLGGPRPVGMRGDPEDVHIPALDLDDEQAVQALQRQRAVDMEEIGGEDSRGLGAQELPPCGVGMSFRRGRYTQCSEDPADRGGTDPEAELE